MQFRFYGHLILLSMALLAKTRDVSGEPTYDTYSSLESEELDQSIEVPIFPNTLSISKDWAIKFDNELGRGESMTEGKRIELGNNLIEMAELLHVIPEGTIPKLTGVSGVLDWSIPNEIIERKLAEDSKPREIPVPPSASVKEADHNPNEIEATNPKFGMYAKKMQ